MNISSFIQCTPKYNSTPLNLISTVKHTLTAAWYLKLAFRGRSVYIDSQQLSIDKFLFAPALKTKWKVSNCGAFTCVSEIKKNVNRKNF